MCSFSLKYVYKDTDQKAFYGDGETQWIQTVSYLCLENLRILISEALSAKHPLYKNSGQQVKVLNIRSNLINSVQANSSYFVKLLVKWYKIWHHRHAEASPSYGWGVWVLPATFCHETFTFVRVHRTSTAKHLKFSSMQHRFSVRFILADSQCS